MTPILDFVVGVAGGVAAAILLYPYDLPIWRRCTIAGAFAITAITIAKLFITI